MNKITADGIYDMSIDAYHGDCCDGPSVSASSLHTILAASPAHYWAYSPLNPKRKEKKSTDAFDFGKAAHALTLGEPEFAKFFFVCPHDALNKNPGKQWHDGWKEEVASGRETRTLVRADAWEIVQEMAAERLHSPQVARAFTNGKPEQSLIWRDKETGIWLKVRPDWLPDEPTKEFTTEYKALKTIKPRPVSSNIFDYGYHAQAAMQMDGVRHVLNVEPRGIAHVVQEKTEPFLAELRLFTPEQLQKGHDDYRHGLHIFADCYARWKAGEPYRTAWYGYTKTATFFDTPSWLKMETTDEHSDGYESRPLSDDED